MRIILATVVTVLPFDPQRITTEISQDRNTINETPPLIQEVRHVYLERSTLMSDQSEDNSTERLLEPSDTPVSPGTIRAVVVVGLITLFIASFLYWQSWKERHDKPPCVTKVKQELSDVVTVQCNRVRANRAAAESGGTRRNEAGEEAMPPLGTSRQGGQQSRKNGEIPATRSKTKILQQSPVPSSPRSTTPSTSMSSSIYHSQASSQMILICETHRPTGREASEKMAVEPPPRKFNSSTTRMPSEQIISHI